LTAYEDGEDKPKVFVSYHTEDVAQARLLGYQLEDEKYNVNAVDNSPKKPYKGDWHKPMEKKIKNSDAVVVVVGEDTHERKAVKWEIKTAAKYDKPVYAVKIKQENEVPQEVYDAGGKVINWNLKRIKYEVHYNT